MFVIKHKFKVGDIVKVVNGKNYCGEILNKICKIIDIIEPPTIDETMYNVSCESVKGTWYVEEDQIVLVSDNYTPSNRITDPNTNYKELFKEPMYIEFIDVGEAFDKLKMYEDKEHSTAVGDTDTVQYSEEWTVMEFEEIKVGDIVFFPSNYTSVKNVRCAKVQEVYPMFIRIAYPLGSTFDLNRKECFKTYEEALAQLK